MTTQITHVRSINARRSRVHLAAVPRHVLERDGQAQPGGAAGQRGQGGRDLQPGQRRAQAVVRAPPEAQVRAAPPGAQRLGVVEAGRVVVRRLDPQEHLVARGDRDAAELQVLLGPAREDLDAEAPDELVDEALDVGPLGEPGQGVGAQQVDHGDREPAPHRDHPGRQQCADESDQLAVAQAPVVGVVHGDEGAEEILAGVLARGRDEPGGERGQRAPRPLGLREQGRVARGGHRVGAQGVLDQAPEPGVLGQVDAEQQPEAPDGQGRRQHVDQVDRAVGVHERRDVGLGERGHPRGQLGDPAWGERPGDEAAQAGVRRPVLEQRRPLVDGDTGRHEPETPVGEPGRDQVVGRDEPRAAPVGAHDTGHRPGRPVVRRRPHRVRAFERQRLLHGSSFALRMQREG